MTTAATLESTDIVDLDDDASQIDEERPPDDDQDETEAEGAAVDEVSTSLVPASSRPQPKTVLEAKGNVGQALLERSGRLTLLTLPVDILHLIFRETTHTNDLTSLALTNSTLHSLAIPHIYARFDIVWPEAHTAAADSKSVDALTYGLSTLCLGSSFAFRTRRLRYPEPFATTPIMRRLNSDVYASYTRKFSLGNGPKDWVSDYMITKEAGKMLGTLVALAVRKMINLETFIWDMPTGVLSDIFMALASLDDHQRPGRSKLDKIWIRWHENSETVPSPPGSGSLPTQQTQAVVLPSNANHTSPLSTGLGHSPHLTLPFANSRVEYPTFSVLPPVRSVTVLDIDELSYLDEIAMLIEKSYRCLQELRIGIASQALSKPWTQSNHTGFQVDLAALWPGASAIGETRYCGVLGILVGRIHDIRQSLAHQSKSPESRSSCRLRDPVVDAPAHHTATVADSVGTTTGLPSAADIESGGSQSAHQAHNHSEDIGHAGSTHETADSSSPTSACTNEHLTKPTASDAGKLAADTQPNSTPPITWRDGRLCGKLRLHTLELERVYLSMPVCKFAIDWTVVTRLTFLRCPGQEPFFEYLHRHFAPTSYPVTGKAANPTRAASSSPQYHLSFKYIHTDYSTTALINLIRDTLAPNTLEVLFLQDRARSRLPSVSIEQIFRGAIKRHRSSLRKLLLDSRGNEDSAGRWQSWLLSSQLLHFVTSGKMSSLRELAVSIDFKDWHLFLQRLPSLSQLRSLNLPNLAGRNTQMSNLDPKELALQIVDIITLRPEIQLCYVGIAGKCFEILESRLSDRSPTPGAAPETTLDVSEGDDTDSDENGDDGDDITASEAEDSTDEEGGDEDTPHSDDGADLGSDTDSFMGTECPSVNLRLREILFYDDKVAIFKARHGRL